MSETYFIHTLGCQANERDSETLAGMLESLGYIQAEDKSKSNIILINTCSVRENADKRFFGILGQLKRIKTDNLQTIIGVCGCMMQQEHIVEDVKRRFPWVDLVFGTHNISSLPSLINQVRTKRERQISIFADTSEYEEGLPAKRQYTHKAFVNIMTGCNNFCTYCVVPYTRGREKSRSVENILAEVQSLADTGVKEITLLGQNVNSYEFGFVDLLHKLEEIPNIYRYRFMTSHPKDISEDLIEAYRSLSKLHPYLHLPVQSGSDSVLARMNRGYTSGEYMSYIQRLRTKTPEMAVSTDLIVGFPGESEQDFDSTMKLIEVCDFDAAFTFIYSKRPFTPAAGYEDQVPEAIKHERFNRMVSLLNSKMLQKNKSYIGRELEILCEGKSKTDPQMLSGRSPENKLVNFSINSLSTEHQARVKAGEDMAGEILMVKINEATAFSLTG